MTEAGPFDRNAVSSSPSQMWARYTRLLHAYQAAPGRNDCPVARHWRAITGEPLSGFADRLSRESPETLVGDVVECLNEVVASLAPGQALADAQSASLLVQMALVAVERWLMAKADLPGLNRGGIALLPLLEDTVAAVVAASCLGLNLDLGVRINSDGEPELEIRNLVADREELQVGHRDARAATARALLSRALPTLPSTPLALVPSDALVFDHVARHARRTGARLIVGLPGPEADLAHHALRHWGAGAFVRQDGTDAAADGPDQRLVALQNDVKTHLAMVRQVLPAQARQATPPSPLGGAAAMVNGAPWVFISYAHEDQALRQEFEQHLGTYTVNKSLRLWTDDLIEAGDQWQAKILEGIQQCHVAVLLLTHHFMASDFIMNTEMRLLGERYDRGEIRIVPILMSPCDARINDWLAARQVVPSIDDPVPRDPASHARQKALVDLARTTYDHATAAHRQNDPSRKPA